MVELKSKHLTSKQRSNSKADPVTPPQPTSDTIGAQSSSKAKKNSQKYRCFKHPLLEKQKKFKPNKFEYPSFEGPLDYPKSMTAKSREKPGVRVGVGSPKFRDILLQKAQEELETALAKTGKSPAQEAKVHRDAHDKFKETKERLDEGPIVFMYVNGGGTAQLNTEAGSWIFFARPSFYWGPRSVSLPTTDIVWDNHELGLDVVNGIDENGAVAYLPATGKKENRTLIWNWYLLQLMVHNIQGAKGAPTMADIVPQKSKAPDLQFDMELALPDLWDNGRAYELRSKPKDDSASRQGQETAAHAALYKNSPGMDRGSSSSEKWKRFNEKPRNVDLSSDGGCKVLGDAWVEATSHKGVDAPPPDVLRSAQMEVGNSEKHIEETTVFAQWSAKASYGGTVSASNNVHDHGSAMRGRRPKYPDEDYKRKLQEMDPVKVGFAHKRMREWADVHWADMRCVK